MVSDTILVAFFLSIYIIDNIISNKMTNSLIKLNKELMQGYKEIADNYQETIKILIPILRKIESANKFINN